MSENDTEHPQRIHVVHDGPRQAPPLLLIHGSGASGGFWAPVVPALARHHHVIRVDLPGCGQSPPPPSYDVIDQQRPEPGRAPPAAVHSSGAAGPAIGPAHLAETFGGDDPQGNQRHGRPPGEPPGRRRRRRPGHHLPRDADGAAPEHRLHRRTKRARTQRGRRPPVAPDAQSTNKRVAAVFRANHAAFSSMSTGEARAFEGFLFVNQPSAFTL
ncbi:alpha/beta fold hydrolase [Nonomuraea sp. NPDC049637]|uniref:alpha/beta fold hydrolase n=1 Tax=Nonomuraea sp. NPDC049637 TaxID=3154356 RepID=UPI003426C1A4